METLAALPPEARAVWEQIRIEGEARKRKAKASKRRYGKQEPTPRQALFLSLPHTEAFYGGAAGGGKSSALLTAALEHADVPRYSALLLRRTFQDLSKPGALMDRAREWLAGSGARWNEQKKQWRFPSGAVLAFGYLENENDKYQYQGSEFQFIGFDELTQFTESQYLYLFSRLRRLKASDVPLRMRSASNPGGAGSAWVQARFIPERWTPLDGREIKVWDKDGRAFVPARLVDNPHLDQQSYAESLANLDDVTRAQLLEGDWQVRERGNIYPAWSDGPDGRHVITWSQFAAVFGAGHIPKHWRGAVGQDWGFDPDPCATVWNWRAAENSPAGLAGSVFCPRILTSQGAIPDEVAQLIKASESAYGEAARIEYRVMSHEASSQLATYARLHDLHFQKWKPDAHGGIAQMQSYLRIRDEDRPHPFKPWLMGRPMYYVVVPDDQVINPRGDAGLALLREEFAVYRYADLRVTPHLGAAAIKPYDFFNHYMDAQRGVAARWFPRAEPLTEDEAIERALPEGWRATAAPSSDADSWRRDGWEMARDIEIGKIKKRMKREQADLNDPWERHSPIANVAGGFWPEGWDK